MASEEQGESALEFADVVDAANEKLEDRNDDYWPEPLYGSIHLSEEWVRLIWKHSIMPEPH